MKTMLAFVGVFCVLASEVFAVTHDDGAVFPFANCVGSITFGNLRPLFASASGPVTALTVTA
jgi:hypothetical protein